jgi:hypothetical protein
MHKFITVLFFFLFFQGMAQYKSPMAKDLDKKELLDSGFRQVYATRYYYDYNFQPEYADSFYMARFDNIGRPVYERFYAGIGDSVTCTYSYGDSLAVEEIKTTYYHGKLSTTIRNQSNRAGRWITWQLNSSPSTLDTSIYDERNRLIKRFNPESGKGSIYFYDKTGRLNRIETTYTDNHSSISYYDYARPDSIVKIRIIETKGVIKDSIFCRFSYDSKGRLIENLRAPSKTYHKNLQIDCSIGDTYYHRYKYDSLDRIIYQSGSEDEIKKGPFTYSDGSYTTTIYNESGYIKQGYFAKNRPGAIYTYTRSESRSNDSHLLRETYDLVSYLTMFLSENSNLPKTVDISGEDQSGTKSTIVYSYYK